MTETNHHPAASPSSPVSPPPPPIPSYQPPLSPPTGGRWSGLLAFTTKRPVAVMMIVVAVLVFGEVSRRALPLELMPRFNYPRLTIETDYPTASPSQVESEVSEAVEDGLGSISKLRAKSSVSRAEKSEVILEFQWGTEMAQAATEVRQKLDRVRLPDDAGAPLLLRYDPAMEPVLRIALTYSDDAAQAAGGLVDDLQRRMELRRIAEQIVKPDLQKLDGIAAVTVLGGAEPHIHITVREARLAQHNMTLAEIAELLRQQNIEQAAGTIEEGRREFLVRTMNRFRSVAEIGGLQVKPGVPLSTIADIVLAEKDPEVKTRLDGKPSVEIEILKEADANIVTLSRIVWERLYGPQSRNMRAERGRLAFQPETERREATLRQPATTGGGGGGPPGRARAALVSDDDWPLAQILAPAVETVVLSDQSFFIEDAINEVWLAAILGGILAVGVLFTFLRQLSKTVIIGLAIPISIVATFTPMNVGNISLNLMSFGGLALGIGMLVDNAIVVLESIARCRDEGDDPFRAAVRGVSEVFGAIVASTLTTVAVFGPVVFVTGVAGQIFGQQALTVVFSLLVSLVVAVFVIPMLAALNLNVHFSHAQPDNVLRPRFVRAAKLWWLSIRHGSMFNPVRALMGRPKAVVPELPPDPQSWLTQITPRPTTTTTGPAADTPTDAPVGPSGPWRIEWPVWLKPIFDLGKGVGLPFVAVWCVVQVVFGLIEWVCVAAFEIVWRYLMLVPALLILATGRFAFVGIYVGAKHLLARPATAFDHGFAAFSAFYRRLLVGSLRRPGAVVAVATILVAIAGMILPTLESELIPRLRQGEFAAEFTLTEGQPLASTESALLALDDVMTAPAVAQHVERYTLVVGESRAASGEKVRRENLARLTVIMKRGAGSDAEESVKQRIRELQMQTPALRPPKFSVPTLFSLQTPLEVEVFGSNLDTIREASYAVEEAMRAMKTPAGQPMFEDVRSSVRRGNPEILIQFDREVLERYGLRVQQAAADLKRKLEGDVPTNFSLGDRRIDVRVELAAMDKPTIERMLDLKLTGNLSVREAASYVFVEGPAEIRRRDNRRTAVVSASPARGVALSEAENRVGDLLASTHFGAMAKISGEANERRESLMSLVGALALAVFLVYVVMASQFESLVQPFIIMLTVPLALVGVIIALWALSLPISVVVIVGVIVLAGIVVNNAIVLIDRINYNRAQGMPVDDAIVEAGVVRLRPILITTLTTVLGLLPLTGWLGWLVGAFGSFGEGQEIRAPMAITVVVGLISSTALTLVVIPVAYRVVAYLAAFGSPPETAATAEPAAALAPAPETPTP